MRELLGLKNGHALRRVSPSPPLVLLRSQRDVETISPWPFPVCDRNQSLFSFSLSLPLAFFLLSTTTMMPPKQRSGCSFDYSLLLFVVRRRMNPPKAENDFASVWISIALHYIERTELWKMKYGQGEK